MLDRALYTKSFDWAYEQEWRLVLPGGKGVHCIDGLALKEVIIGAAAGNDLLRNIVAWTRELKNPLAIYRAAASTNTFEIELRRYR